MKRTKKNYVLFTVAMLSACAAQAAASADKKLIALVRERAVPAVRGTVIEGCSLGDILSTLAARVEALTQENEQLRKTIESSLGIASAKSTAEENSVIHAARALAGQKQYAEALKKCQKGLSIDGLSQEAQSFIWELMGYIYSTGDADVQQNYNAALEYYNRALQWSELSSKRRLQIDLARCKIYSTGDATLEKNYPEIVKTCEQLLTIAELSQAERALVEKIKKRYEATAVCASSAPVQCAASSSAKHAHGQAVKPRRRTRKFSCPMCDGARFKTESDYAWHSEHSAFHKKNIEQQAAQ